MYRCTGKKRRAASENFDLARAGKSSAARVTSSSRAWYSMCVCTCTVLRKDIPPTCVRRQGNSLLGFFAKAERERQRETFRRLVTLVGNNAVSARATCHREYQLRSKFSDDGSLCNVTRGDEESVTCGWNLDLTHVWCIRSLSCDLQVLTISRGIRDIFTARFYKSRFRHSYAICACINCQNAHFYTDNRTALVPFGISGKNLSFYVTRYRRGARLIFIRITNDFRRVSREGVASVERKRYERRDVREVLGTKLIFYIFMDSSSDFHRWLTRTRVHQSSPDDSPARLSKLPLF